MKMPSKVLWSEGWTISPQQFQQQDRYHEARLRRFASVINPWLWGVREITWKHEELHNNLLAAESMSLIFQDGEVVEAPLTDILPAPVDLATLSKDETVFTFHAALPVLKPYGSNVSSLGAPPNGVRYVQFEAETPDMFSDAISVDVAYLRNTVRLLPQSEATASYVALPVVRLRRVPSGGFEIDPGFIPPSLTIGAASGLHAMLDRLLGKLRAKVESLYGLHAQTDMNTVEVRSGDISSFWMLHTISTACASLGHYARFRELHPESLFVDLLALAGGLMAMSTKYRLADLPDYDHADPASGFAALDTIIRDLTDTVIAQKYFTIALERDKERTSYYRGTLEPARIDQHTILVLAVNADLPAQELITAIPRRFKVGAPDDVEQIVKSALPGAELSHLPQVPAAIPVRPNTYYFSIGNRGALYENMLEAQALAIYVPSGISGLKLELIAITG